MLQVGISHQKVKDSINDAITNDKFSDCLKPTNISPAFKKVESTDRENYRLAGVLPFLLKVFEQLIYDQV